jgi:hypothetical protein
METKVRQLNLCRPSSPIYAAMQNKFHIFVRATVKPMTDQQLQDWLPRPAGWLPVAAAFKVSNK